MSTLKNIYQTGDTVRLNFGSGLEVDGTVTRSLGYQAEVQTPYGVVTIGNKDARIVPNVFDPVGIYNAAKGVRHG